MRVIKEIPKEIRRLLKNKWYYYFIFAQVYGYASVFFGMLLLISFRTTYDATTLAKAIAFLSFGMVAHYLGFKAFFTRVERYVKRADGKKVHS
ncbi:hypothetical protein [Geoglobus ahangari]